MTADELRDRAHYLTSRTHSAGLAALVAFAERICPGCGALMKRVQRGRKVYHYCRVCFPDGKRGVELRTQESSALSDERDSRHRDV
jgi:hypothetical protein